MSQDNGKTVTLTIDDEQITAPAGATLLDVARKAGHDIPSLCAHPALEPFGACRLCVVEIQKPGWDDWYKQLVTSCLYPVSEGLKVWTNSDEVRANRQVVLDLQLARVPDSKHIQALAADYGVTETSYTPRENADTCIMCTICVRACEAVGAFAIATLSRGPDKYVDVPNKDACIGCLVCAKLCPTDAIPFTENDNGVRRIWDKGFELVMDERTGEVLGTPQYLARVKARVEENGMRWPDELPHASAMAKRYDYARKLSSVAEVEDRAAE